MKWRKRFGFSAEGNLKDQLKSSKAGPENSYVNHILKFCKEVIAYPDAYIGWQKFAVENGIRLLEEGDFDAILSSSGPETCHIIANKLKIRYDLPWIADFRDLWTLSTYYPYGALRRFIEQRMEKKVISDANILITVSYPLAEQLKSFHKKAAYVVPNGFDADLVNPGMPLTKKFGLVYTGYIYKGKRDPEPLFSALRELSNEGKINLQNVTVDFYGYRESWLEKTVKQYDLQETVSIHGLISREEAIMKQRESQILVLLSWNDPNEKGVYTGKIFDYLASRRPILSIGTSEGVAEELLRETNAGVNVSTVDEIKKELIKAYDEFIHSGEVCYHGNISKINKYTHKEMARKLAEILDNLA